MYFKDMLDSINALYVCISVYTVSGFAEKYCCNIARDSGNIAKNSTAYMPVLVTLPEQAIAALLPQSNLHVKSSIVPILPEGLHFAKGYNNVGK